MTWKINTPDNLALARTIGREFASIIAAGQQKYLDQNEQGYGNYGTSNLVPAQPEQLIMQTLDQDINEKDGKDRARSLFLENYPRLQELKKKYDPENIFNKWFAIIPSS